LPNLGSTESVRNAVLSMTIRSIQRSIENKIKVNAAANKNVSGFIDTYNQVRSTANKLLTDAKGYDYDAMIAAGATNDEIEKEFLNLK